MVAQKRGRGAKAQPAKQKAPQAVEEVPEAEVAEHVGELEGNGDTEQVEQGDEGGAGDAPSENAAQAEGESQEAGGEAPSEEPKEEKAISEEEWLRLFRKEVPENYTNSITFVKQLTVVAVSTITYLKNALPEESYVNENFGGLKLKILKHRCQDELAQFVSTSMQQAFDAFDKKYVHSFALCFYRGECSADNLLEYHEFEYAYTPEGVSLIIDSTTGSGGGARHRHALRCSLDDVKRRTTMLLRSLALFVYHNCTQDLPINYDIGLRLYYTEDSPEDYQAPGFRPGPDHLEATAHDALCLGKVETPFHKLTARSFVRDPMPWDSDVVTPSDTLPEMTQDASEDFEGWGPRLQCPCAVSDREGALVTCQYCRTQQHAACFGLMQPVAEHCCAACAESEPGRAPSCPILSWIDTRKQQGLCLFRRSLVLCSTQVMLSGAELAEKLRLPSAGAARVLRQLQTHDVLAAGDPHDLTVPRKVNPLQLKLLMKRFFAESDSVVERLVTETERSGAGPGTKAPGPSLGLGPEPPGSEDRWMRQYRDVVVEAERRARASERGSDALPLSGPHNPVQGLENLGRGRGRSTKAPGPSLGLGPEPPGSEDRWMRQYRDVVIEAERRARASEAGSDALPLSGPHNPVQGLENLGRGRGRSTKAPGPSLGLGPEPPGSEDRWMRQYRDVVIEAERRARASEAGSDALPLSGPHNPVQGLENLGRGLRRGRGKRQVDDADADADAGECRPAKLPKLRSGADCCFRI